MLRVSSIGIGWLALAASIAVHAAAFLTGADPQVASAPVAEVAASVELDTAPEADEVIDPPRDAPPAFVAPPVAPTVHPVAATRSARPSAVAHASDSATPAQTPPALAATSEPMAHFTITLGTTSATHGTVAPGATARTAAATSHESDDDGAPIAAELASTPAERVVGPKPVYPAEAQAQGIEGDVFLEIVIDKSGAVESARALKPSGFGFEEAALAAVRAYRYRPAMRDGHAIRVRMRVPMQFRFE